ncbi:MAG: class I tRNA ligase family protein [Oscillospiraceae bacterium]
MTYDFQTIEPKWQKIWEEQNLYATVNGSERRSSTALVEFPYPSGQGLHVGHAGPYTAMDIIARKKRMRGLQRAVPHRL